MLQAATLCKGSLINRLFGTIEVLVGEYIIIRISADQPYKGVRSKVIARGGGVVSKNLHKTRIAFNPCLFYYDTSWESLPSLPHSFNG